MAKGARTRERTVARAAQVFSTRGYFGASMTDLLTATGLQKGGLYNHFASKEALALAAFDHSIGLISARFEAALREPTGAVDRLLAVVGVIRSLVDDPVLEGGCPILNTAVEADDALPALRARAQQAMDAWQRLIGSIVKQGIAAGEFTAGTDPRAVATVVTATLEGAVMLSKLYGDPAHMRRAVLHVRAYVRSLTPQTSMKASS